MSPPIYTPDGSEVNEIVLPDGSTASEVIGPDGNVVFEAGPDIPDSVVSRPDDDDYSSGIIDGGLEIETHSQFSGIGARISSNTSNPGNTAYLLDGSLNEIDTTDISGLSAGDAFSFEGLDLPAGTYVIYIDSNGAGYHGGGHSYPYTGSELDITATYSGGSVETSNQPRSINDIGNPDGILD